MTTSPDGALVSPRQRIAEILTRYKPGDPVRRAVVRSGPALITTTESVWATLAACRAGAPHAGGRSRWVKGELPN